MSTRWHKCPDCGQRIKLLRKRCVECAEIERVKLERARKKKSRSKP